MTRDAIAEEVLQTLKNVLVHVKKGVVGMQAVKVWKKKGNALWTEVVIKEVMEENKCMQENTGKKCSA